MIEQITLAAALAIGFAGSVHCLGMCGGIAGALGMGVSHERRRGPRLLAYVVLYNLGRIASYAAAGAVAGGFGLWLGNALGFSAWSDHLRIATGLVTIAIGLQVAVNWRLLAPVEAIGLRFWQRLAPLARRLMPVRSPQAALALGALWGWLPCGMVYGMLVAAAASGSPAQGAGLMLAFGLGTAPSLIAAGAAAGRLGRMARRRGFRRTAGALVVLAGVWILVGPMALHGAGQPAPGADGTASPAAHRDHAADTSALPVPDTARAVMNSTGLLVV